MHEWTWANIAERHAIAGRRAQDEAKNEPDFQLQITNKTNTNVNSQQVTSIENILLAANSTSSLFAVSILAYSIRAKCAFVGFASCDLRLVCHCCCSLYRVESNWSRFAANTAVALMWFSGGCFCFVVLRVCCKLQVALSFVFVLRKNLLFCLLRKTEQTWIETGASQTLLAKLNEVELFLTFTAVLAFDVWLAVCVAHSQCSYALPIERMVRRKTEPSNVRALIIWSELATWKTKRTNKQANNKRPNKASEQSAHQCDNIAKRAWVSNHCNNGDCKALSILVSLTLHLLSSLLIAVFMAGFARLIS